MHQPAHAGFAVGHTEALPHDPAQVDQPPGRDPIHLGVPTVRRVDEDDDNPLAWMLSVNGVILDARHAPRAIQEEALRLGLIPYLPESHS